MREKHEIIKLIRAAQSSSENADKFIEKYLPFIKSETAKFIGRIPVEGHDDELSIAMFAFYEAMMAYSAEKGAFLPLASVAIKNRLIDYTRKEAKHKGVISYDADKNEEGKSLIDDIADESDEHNEVVMRSAAKKEIDEYIQHISEYGLELSDIADSCPKQERTINVCMKILGFARKNPHILDELVKSRKLPISAIINGTGAERKTIERHRKYLVAILLAFTNGFEIIREHLHELQKREDVRI